MTPERSQQISRAGVARFRGPNTLFASYDRSFDARS
jgi:hypothetical protein